MPKKTTPAERFAAMFELWNDFAATDDERQTAKRKCDEWLKAEWQNMERRLHDSRSSRS